MERENNSMFNANDRNCRLFRPNWENSMDQNDPFESALSSMVSSPTASNNNINGENIVLRELIGRLGSICNSGEISPFNGNDNNNNSANTSCYNTPLNSPPKLNLSSMMERGNIFLSHPSLPPLSADPAFAERAAKFSCFGSQPPTTLEEENADSRENSTVSDAVANPRKRKSSAPKAPAPNPAKDNAANGVCASEKSESSGKRSKSEEKQKQSKDKDNEAPKDYIHVRARRGQATDAHSLAERVRREKIGERMKVLQDLVPGCNKVTGKAVMLDEIINYVQSLQRQVEFLSMKLATVNPRTDFNMEAFISKDMFHSRGSLPHSVYSSDGYPVQSRSNQGIPTDNFGDDASQVSSFWENDLHSIVNMGFGQGQTQNFEGIVPTAQMKVEL